MRLLFRPIHPAQVPEASQLIDAAYAPQVRLLYGEGSPMRRWRHYDERKIEAYMDREPEGVRVGVWRDKIVTFVACRSYGRLGWFHTLAVHPRFQDRGLGKMAVQDAEAYLWARGVTSLGLMTWPTAVKNLAFYQRLGYRQAGLSLHAYRETHQPLISGRSPFYATQLRTTRVDELSRLAHHVRWLGQQIMAGLDYWPWLAWAHEQSYADALLLWQDQRLMALVLAYFFPDAHWAETKLVLLSPSLGQEDVLWVLEHFRQWVMGQGRSVFGMEVDLSADFGRKVLLPHGFRYHHEVMVNMVKGDDLPPAGLHFVRFGG